MRGRINECKVMEKGAGLACMDFGEPIVQYEVFQCIMVLLLAHPQRTELSRPQRPMCPSQTVLCIIGRNAR